MSFPQTEVVNVQIEASPVQTYPTSTVQVLEQPSPETVLPSSQPSFEATNPSPHTLLQTEGAVPVQ